MKIKEGKKRDNKKELKIDFLEELERLKKPVRRALFKYLPKKKPFEHYRMVRNYPLREGKYFRPALLLLSLDLYGGNMKDGLLPAAAVQASEEWLLIHDDMEDHSQLRRHKPSLNKVYGDELAINAGDALHIIMWNIMSDFTRKFKNKKIAWEVFAKLNRAVLSATEGQYLELAWIREKRIKVSEKEYLDMVKRKTASYSVLCPLKIGALLAGRNVKEVERIEKWAIPFAYSFQIADDCMNLKISAKKQGKENAGDILEGKRTLITSHLFACASKKEKAKIEKIYCKKRENKTEKEKRLILKLMRKYGSIAFAEGKARKYGRLALKIFTKQTSGLKATKAQRILREAIEFAWKRQK